MIFRPVSPLSPTGPPITNLPVGLTRILIRAPYIDSVSDNVEVLAAVDGKIVAAKQDNQLVTAFHPELNDNLSVHQYFVNMVSQKA